MKTTYTYKNLPDLFFLSAVLSIFGMLFTSQAYAQQEELLDRVWYLYKLEIDGEEYLYHNLEIQSGDEANIVIMLDDELNSYIEMWGCPGWGCIINIEFVENESQFILDDMVCLTMSPCDYYTYGNHSQYGSFSDYFDGFYRNNYDSIMDYNYETINTIEYLIFTDENGDKLYYTAENLSVADFNELIFTIYPNPAQDWLHIHLEGLSNNTSLEVYDVHGRLLKRIMLSELETQLDVSEYASGLYFIKLKNALGTTHTVKFIKK